MANLKRTAIMAGLCEQARLAYLYKLYSTSVEFANKWHALATENERRRAPKFLKWTGRTK